MTQRNWLDGRTDPYYGGTTAELTQAPTAWRARIEHRWENEWLPKSRGTTTHPDA